MSRKRTRRDPVHLNKWVDFPEIMTEVNRAPGQWQPLCGTLPSLAPKRSVVPAEVTCRACKAKLVDARLTR